MHVCVKQTPASRFNQLSEFQPLNMKTSCPKTRLDKTCFASAHRNPKVDFWAQPPVRFDCSTSCDHRRPTQKSSHFWEMKWCGDSGLFGRCSTNCRASHKLAICLSHTYHPCLFYPWDMVPEAYSRHRVRMHLFGSRPGDFTCVRHLGLLQRCQLLSKLPTH